MARWRIGLLLALGVTVAVLGAIGISTPGYMDAEYYFVTGLELSRGNGFYEPLIWNYLSNPTSIPHPSHAYWMPLTSLLAALPMSIAGESFRSAQSGFLLLFGTLPLLTATFSFSLFDDEDAAFLGGLFSLVPGFFFPYFLTTDMFIIYAWIGALFFWSLHAGSKRGSLPLYLASGALIGLAHLARADGPLLFIPFLYFSLKPSERDSRQTIIGSLGYLFVMLPWFVRNLSTYGSIMPPGNQATFWLRSYEDLFRYPASVLSPAYLIDAGWTALLSVRMGAIWTNIQRVVAENGLIFLLPFMLIGGVEWRNLKVVRAAMLYWIVLLLVMSFVFPFAGSQGGTFHSSAALMPILWCFVPFGLRRVVGFVGTRRGWDVPAAARNFGWIFLAMAAIFTAGLYFSRVFTRTPSGMRWGADQSTYRAVGERLKAIDPDPELIAVNNPPGFYAATGIPAVVIPAGGDHALLAVVGDFHVDYVILDANHPMDLTELYERKRDLPGLTLVETIDSGTAAPILLFQVSAEGKAP